MGLYWNPTGALGVAAMVVSLLLAWMVYASAPRRATNRILALTLFFEAVAVGAGAGFTYLLDEREEARAAQAVSITASLVLPSLYLMFLGQLGTPFVAIFRTQGARLVLGLIGVAFAVHWFLRPSEYLTRCTSPEADGYNYAKWDCFYGSSYINIGYLRVAVLLFALAVSIHGTWVAHEKQLRQRMFAYTAAFGTRDVFQILIILSFGDLAIIPSQVADSTAWVYASVVGFPLMIFVYVPLLAYGILKTHLLDLQVKVTIRRGTLGGIFLAVFFIFSQVGQNLINATFGMVTGGLAAGLLLFAIAPLQRLAERVANMAMPGVKTIPEMEVPERVNLYKEQLERAWSDGSLSKKERLMLDNLRERLGITRESALHLEVQVTSPSA